MKYPRSSLSLSRALSFGRFCYHSKSIETLLAHAGCDAPNLEYGTVTPPIHFSTTFQRNIDGTLPSRFAYSRESNPTRCLLEETFAELEGGHRAYAFSSGMQAAMAFLLSCPGAHVILPDDLYFGV
jgi:cystathionine gamma-synthase